MKVKLFFEVGYLDDVGERGALGVALDIGESDGPVDYEALAKSVDKDRILYLCGLAGVVGPEDMTILTPEEYDLKYGDDAEEEIDRGPG